MTPDIGGARCRRSSEGDKVFAAAGGKLAAAARGAAARRRRCAGSSTATSSASPPATFRLIASPLVTWIWLGAIIVFLGGLIALWPASATPRRRRVAAALRGARRARTSARPPSAARVAAGDAPERGAGGRRRAARRRRRRSAAVVALVAAPLRAARAVDAGARERRPARRARGAQGGQVPRDPRRRAGPPTGKLSEEDYRALDRQLRAEAVEILRALDDARRARAGARYPDAMENILSVVQVVALGRRDLPRAHALGKDAGLSGAFGVGTGSGPFGGGSLVERNLNRWTVGFAIAFVAEHDHPAEALALERGRRRR